MSFVDLKGSVRWNERDIVGRMEETIRESCPATEELILHRKLWGHSLGFYALSPEEQAEIAAYAAVCAAAQQAGRDARLDAALLNRVLDHEQGLQALAEGDAEGHALLAQRAPVSTPTTPA